MPAKARKKKAGRPQFEITPAVCKKAEREAAKGATEKQIAISLNISQETLIRKKQKYSEFSEAIKKGQAKAIVKVENALFDEGVNERNVTALIFFLKNRNPEYWKDKQEVEHSGQVGLSDVIKKARERVHEPDAES